MVQGTKTNANIDAVLEEDNKIIVNDVLHEINEQLDFKDRVVNFAVGYGFLVVATTSQGYVYNVVNWNTPALIDLKETVNLIVQGTKFFAFVDSVSGISIYNYEGKILSSPKYSGLRVEFLNQQYLSVSLDVVTILDTSNKKLIRIFDTATGKAANINIEHSLVI